MNAAEGAIDSDSVYPPSAAWVAGVRADTPAQLDIRAGGGQWKIDDDVAVIVVSSAPGSPVGKRVMVTTVDFCIITVAGDESASNRDDVCKGISSNLYLDNPPIITVGGIGVIFLEGVSVPEGKLRLAKRKRNDRGDQIGGRDNIRVRAKGGVGPAVGQV